jgi:hypothetical protein
VHQKVELKRGSDGDFAMRTQKVASGRAWHVRQVGLVFMCCVSDGPGSRSRGHDASFHDATGSLAGQRPPSLAFGRYLASLDRTSPAEWSTIAVEIEAALPQLAKHAHLKAIQRRGTPGNPGYQVFDIGGDSIVRREVIARYLTAEKKSEAIPKASVAISPANYKFRYAGSFASGDALIYVYQVKARKKRTGLIEGQLWIDAATGLAVRESGHLVKRPSIFMRRIELVRDTQLCDGVPCSETTRISIDTRLVGRAALTIRKRPYIRSKQVTAGRSSSMEVRQAGEPLEQRFDVSNSTTTAVVAASVVGCE